MKNTTKISFALLFWVLCFVAQAQQNLVPNPSFEEYSFCPTFGDQLNGNCYNWRSFRGTSDYFNNCSSSYGFNNVVGYQQARTGEAYAGYVSCVPANSNKEQFGAELLSPLEMGIRYYVSFYVSCSYGGISIATNKIGVRFSTFQYNDPITLPLPNACQIYTNDIVSDTLNWVKIQGSFIADSAYRYIIIGQFFDDAHIDTAHLLNQSPVANLGYYYVDDVCVSTNPILCNVDIDCTFELPSAFSPNGDNINDEYKWVQNCNSVDEFSMHIYNRWGELVFNSSDYNIGWDGKYKNEPQPVDAYAVYISVVLNGKQISKSTSMILLR